MFLGKSVHYLIVPLFTQAHKFDARGGGVGEAEGTLDGLASHPVNELWPDGPLNSYADIYLPWKVVRKLVLYLYFLPLFFPEQRASSIIAFSMLS